MWVADIYLSGSYTVELSPGLMRPLGESGNAFLLTPVGIVNLIGLSALGSATCNHTAAVSESQRMCCVHASHALCTSLLAHVPTGCMHQGLKHMLNAYMLMIPSWIAGGSACMQQYDASIGSMSDENQSMVGRNWNSSGS